MLKNSREVRARAPAPAHCNTHDNGGDVFQVNENVADLRAALRPPDGGGWDIAPHPEK